MDEEKPVKEKSKDNIKEPKKKGEDKATKKIVEEKKQEEKKPDDIFAKYGI